MGIFKDRGIALLAKADITLNGARPWDLQTDKPEALFRKTFTAGSRAFCEAYMDGEWDCSDLFGLLRRLFEADLKEEVNGFAELLLKWKAHWNQQTRALSRRVAEKHYDLNNEFYSLLLDPSMTYSCGRSVDDKMDDLAAAQARKRQGLIKKSYLESGMSAFDIGCGWGALAKDLAECGAKVTGATLSHEQAIWARRICDGLPVEILEKDYRDVGGQFDRIFSVGMIEHVGVKNYDTYMQTAFERLNSFGFFVCHGIVGRPNAKDAFLDKYIFPGGELGATWQVQKSAEKAGFKVEDWENFGNDYYLTLIAWDKNFVANRDKILSLISPKMLDVFGTRKRFLRGFRMYLVGCAALFYVRDTSVGQWVLSKGFKGKVYKAFRF